MSYDYSYKIFLLMSKYLMLNSNLKKIGFIFLSSLFVSLASCSNDQSKAENQETKVSKVLDESPMKSSHTQIEKIKWYSYTDGIKKAKLENKPIVIDFYTDWCTYCKKMDAETYSEQKIYNYLNEKFIPIKVNAESKNKVKFDGKEMTEKDLAMGFQVNSYPTIFFMENEKNTIGTAPGFIDPLQFYTISTYVGSNAYKKMTLEKFKESPKT